MGLSHICTKSDHTEPSCLRINTDMLVGMCKVFLGRVQLLEMMADDRCCTNVRTKIPILDATFYLVHRSDSM